MVNSQKKNWLNTHNIYICISDCYYFFMLLQMYVRKWLSTWHYHMQYLKIFIFSSAFSKHIFPTISYSLYICYVIFRLSDVTDVTGISWRHWLPPWVKKHGGWHGAEMLGRRLGFAFCPHRVPHSPGKVTVCLYKLIGSRSEYQTVFSLRFSPSFSLCVSG